MEEVFANHVSCKELISKIHFRTPHTYIEGLLQLNSKWTNNLTEKMRKGPK